MRNKQCQKNGAKVQIVQAQKRRYTYLHRVIVSRNRLETTEEFTLMSYKIVSKEKQNRIQPLAEKNMQNTDLEDSEKGDQRYFYNPGSTWK